MFFEVRNVYFMLLYYIYSIYAAETADILHKQKGDILLIF